MRVVFTEAGLGRERAHQRLAGAVRPLRLSAPAPCPPYVDGQCESSARILSRDGGLQRRKSPESSHEQVSPTRTALAGSGCRQIRRPRNQISGVRRKPPTQASAAGPIPLPRGTERRDRVCPGALLLVGECGVPPSLPQRRRRRSGTGCPDSGLPSSCGQVCERGMLVVLQLSPTAPLPGHRSSVDELLGAVEMRTKRGRRRTAGGCLNP
jgi:hypothetical protein